MNRRAKLLSTVVAIMILTFAVRSQAMIKIGVLAKRGAPKCMKNWGATGAYLSKQIGQRCIILPLKFTAIEPALKAKRIDLLLANSAFYVQMKKKYGVKAIATLINSRKGQALRQFGGVILVKKDSPIKTLADIRGKKFMCVKSSSFGGGQMAWRLLIDNGIDPKKDCSAFLEGKKHDNVVLAVQNGSADVGTVRSDTMERMQDEGKIKMDEFRIIHQIKDSFPFVHSTQLYPEWPMAAAASLDPATADKIAKALIAITANSQAAKSAKIAGWCKPLDYKPVTECLKAIHYGIFAK